MYQFPRQRTLTQMYKILNYLQYRLYKGSLHYKFMKIGDNLHELIKKTLPGPTYECGGYLQQHPWPMPF